MEKDRSSLAMHLLQLSLLLPIAAGLSWRKAAGEKDATVTHNLQLMSSCSPQSFRGGCLHPLKQQDGAAGLPAWLQAVWQGTLLGHVPAVLMPCM